MRLPTASKLDLFRACGGPWRLPLPETRDGSSKAAEKGKALHRYAETGISQSKRGKPTLDEEAVSRALDDLPSWVSLVRVEPRECVVRYRPRDGVAEVVGRSLSARPYGDADDEWIWGTADLVGVTEGGERLLVADLKTGSAGWLKLPWGDLDEVPLQTPFLAAVFNRVLHFSSALVGIVSSATERAYLRSVDAAWLESVLEYVSRLCAAPPTKLTPGEYCTFCLVRGSCPLFATTRTPSATGQT